MISLALPSHLEQSIARSLNRRGLGLDSAKKLADAVHRLSDFYINHPTEATPWHQDWAKTAYISYYLPLNFLRSQFVMREAERIGFFNGLSKFVDIGAGLGSASLSLLEGRSTFDEGLLVEHSAEAMEIQRQDFPLQGQVRTSWSEQIPNEVDGRSSLAIMSYSLTEILESPRQLENFDALLIIEPSTQEDGRRLLELRQSLIDKGFYAWAPCLHQKACPLLAHSKTDWCHHKFKAEMPQWFHQLTKHLPMQTEVLSLSYLLMRKDPPQKSEATARVIGDPLVEKGKTRQLICQGPDREFLSWLRRNHKKPKTFQRHDLIQFLENLEKNGNEIRVPEQYRPIQL